VEQKTLKELRAIAHAARLRGYSDLNKKELIELLKKRQARLATSATERHTALKKAPKTKSTRRKTSPQRALTAPPPAARELFPERIATIEEHIESAKFEMAPPGAAFVPAPPGSSSLHENIESLPAPSEPLLCLLPQKPGVVHAYWVLQSGVPIKQLRLRLSRIGHDAIELLEETEVPGERGHWYFHVPESADAGNFFAQLGYYDAAGKFIGAIRRGIARIPSLYASERTDRRWWVSDEEFHAMYMRAGGAMRDARLLWPGSSSSNPQK
jgi:hypothetical protein